MGTVIKILHTHTLYYTQVGVEQEKVGKEKEIADAEEKKVAKINEDVTKKQRDCENDLAKAEPALKVQWGKEENGWKEPDI